MKKITFIFVLLLMSAVSFTTAADNNVRGDVDGDGRVSIGDVTTLINYLLSGVWPESAHDYVDLGLPSGTLWATCNVGASNPEDCGDYFAWGETAPKEDYEWVNYKWCNGSMYTLTKYCIDSSFGIVDNKTELEPEDDAAYVNWGPLWHIPTLEQLQELLNNCTSNLTTRNGVNGYQVTGPNGNSLFIPATRYSYEGYYWTSTLSSGESRDAYHMDFSRSEKPFLDFDDRAYGFSIRPVRASRN